VAHQMTRRIKQQLKNVCTAITKDLVWLNGYAFKLKGVDPGQPAFVNTINRLTARRNEILDIIDPLPGGKPR
jgi:hypothetical protein